ncbi:hypothetical protein FGU71_12995 [Erythrobacter insulae]|uniref:DUF3618 domain-containing protein n=1 Tax=Erythrobacter insulae TaxID=2584124 RepID=A0A547P6Z8_9SPHN|nr:hypothetical protein [Erythrobacter insulae]TRD09916.1 hypothetical protein FGU71_12995 [Erythrobacter insulae]
MSKLDRQFYEDRALRDAAREVIEADISHAKLSLSGKSIAGRVTERIGDGAKDVFEVAKTHGEDHRGIIAALIGAIILWFARGPILEALGLSDEEPGEDRMDPDGSFAADPAEAADQDNLDSAPLQANISNNSTPIAGDTHD